jgi:hypothetical protein
MCGSRVFFHINIFFYLCPKIGRKKMLFLKNDYLCIAMAAKKAIRILRDFFREQGKDDRVRAVAVDDEAAIELIANTRNPAIAEAKRRQVTITVAQGDTIYKISPDGTKEAVGHVASEVRLTKRRFSLQ